MRRVVGAVEKRNTQSITPDMIAACGMDCTLCIGYLRERKPCAGCRGNDANKPSHCAVCVIKNCDQIAAGESGFCYECVKFPCARLRQLDKRYRTKYGMSMIENLERIREGGLEAFVDFERERWECPECGGVISVHRDACIYCGAPKG